jgi:DNA primase
MFGVVMETHTSLESLAIAVETMAKEPKEVEHTRISLPYTVPVYDAPNALDYLQERGVSEEQIAMFSIRYCPKGPYADRIIVPIVDHNYCLISFVGRLVREARKSERKYVYASGVNVASTLFGLYLVKKEKRVIFVEGVFDYFRVEPYFPVVATFGKAFPVKRTSILKNTAIQDIGLLWDADAYEEMRRVQKSLKQFNVEILQLPEGVKDPGDLNDRQLRRLTKSWKKDSLERLKQNLPRKED